VTIDWLEPDMYRFVVKRVLAVIASVAGQSVSTKSGLEATHFMIVSNSAGMVISRISKSSD